jgi:hypothetical protein
MLRRGFHRLESIRLRDLSSILVAMLLSVSIGAGARAQTSADSASREENPAGASAPQPSLPVDLSGVWAQKLVITAVSNPPIVDPVTTATTTYLRVEIDQDPAGKLALKTAVCDISIQSDFDRIRTVIPDRFVAALNETRRTGSLIRVNDELHLKVAPHTEVLGATLRQPRTEALPSDADDFRVTDPDGDDKPGMTVRVEGLIDGAIYIVQRGRDAYRGKLLSANRIRGRVRWSNEQVVLDSTSIFLGDPPPTRAHPDPARSFFEMRRLKGPASCAGILAGRKTLFPSH